MSRSPAMSGKAMATKSLNEKWSSMVQSANEKGENGTGGSSIVTAGPSQRLFFKVIGVTSYPHFDHHFHSSTGCKPNPCVSLSQECTHVVFLLGPLMNMGNMFDKDWPELGDMARIGGCICCLQTGWANRWIHRWKSIQICREGRQGKCII